MRNIKKLFGSIFVLAAMILGFSTKCYAAEGQYTDNVIPKMTSNTAPSGKASANSTYNSSMYFAYHAFDHDTSVTTNAWVTKEGVNTGWLEYEFNDAKCITKYTITSRNISYALPELPKNWTFEAWDDQLLEWVVLDTQNNITDWQILVKKEFTFNNNNNYYRYRINISANNGKYYIGIGELEMMETLNLAIISAPTNLKATAGNSNVDLSWDEVDGAISYNIKRRETTGDEYMTIATGITINSYSDSTVSNGKTYYYVVTAVNTSGTESANSNEVSATPVAEIITGSAILDIYFDNGTMKEYNLTSAELSDFLTWYDGRSAGAAKAYYIFNVKGTVSPYKSIKNYVPYSKILYFDVKEY